MEFPVESNASIVYVVPSVGHTATLFGCGGRIRFPGCTTTRTMVASNSALVNLQSKELQSSHDDGFGVA